MTGVGESSTGPADIPEASDLEELKRGIGARLDELQAAVQERDALLFLLDVIDAMDDFPIPDNLEGVLEPRPVDWERKRAARVRLRKRIRAARTEMRRRARAAAEAHEATSPPERAEDEPSA